MKEYLGDGAYNYNQTDGKRFLLFPAIKRQLSKLENVRLLDLGCGAGDIYDLIKDKNIDYYGLDISAEMLERAKQQVPDGYFIQASATEFSSTLGTQFDVIISSMLYPSFGKLKDIAKSLEECKKALKEDGMLIIGIAHPSYDRYMQKGLFQKEDVEADFEGFFDSGKKFLIHKMIDGKEFTFEDYHWTLEDYSRALQEAGFVIEFIDECKPEEELLYDKSILEKKNIFPSYMVIKAKLAK
jgi:SAM-dependent methyltransferase